MKAILSPTFRKSSRAAIHVGLAAIILAKLFLPLTVSAASQGSLDLSTLDSKDQAVNALQPTNPITQAKFFASGYQGDNGAHIVYKYSPNAPALDVPLTALVSYIATDASGASGNDWIFDLAAGNGSTLGFYVHSVANASDSAQLFYAPGDPATDSGT